MGAVWRLHITLLLICAASLLLMLMANLYQPAPLKNCKALTPALFTIRNSIEPVLTGYIYITGHERSHPELCPSLGAKLHLVILVTSAPSHIVARDAIRRTWGHYAFRSDVALAFVIGTPPENLTEAIDKEDMLHGDIIIGRFIDSNSNLTLKTLSMLEWVDTYCNRVPRMLKTNDDMFINVPRLIAFAFESSQKKATKTIWGRVMKTHYLVPNKHFELLISSHQYPEIYLNYTTGQAYLLTTDVIKDILFAAKNEPYLGKEDIFITGVLGGKLGINIKDEALFNNLEIMQHPHPCIVQKMISLRRRNYNETFHLWRKMFDDTFDCDLFRIIWVPRLIDLNEEN